MKKLIIIQWIFLGLLLLLGSACTLTPHTNIGLNLDYYGGGFHLRPSAEVGIYGRP